MDYIFYYSGELPKHVLTSLNAVLSVEDDSKIYFCGSDNSKLVHDRVTFIDSKYFFDSHYINKIEELEKFERLDNNPLWKTSLQRIFYLYEIANYFNIDKFIHFDNDVIVFKPFDAINTIFENSKINITKLSKDMLIFGYSYIDSLETYKKVCDTLVNIYENKKFYEDKYYDGKSLVEMRGLYLSYLEENKFFNILPTLPKENNNFLFDPGSYGQYLGGLHNKRFSKRYIDKDHQTYDLLNGKEIMPVYEGGKAYINFYSQKIDLVNLHVHSKKLDKYLPKNYVEFLK